MTKERSHGSGRGFEDFGRRSRYEEKPAASQPAYHRIDPRSGPVDQGGTSERRPQMEATMYFSYGLGRRAGVKATSTFQAILSGERTSTTRFDNWPGSDRWGRLKPGAVVRFFEDKDKSGRFVDVRVTGVERIDLAQASPERLEEWSRAEGWSVEAGRNYGRKNQPGWQVRYEPVPGQEILTDRGLSGTDLALLAAARERRYGFGR